MNLKIEKQIGLRTRILGGLYGAIVGDAVGVPYEFRSRENIAKKPCVDMVGYGTHHQPKGTWSDDGALLIATAHSLTEHEFDPQDMGNKFVDWYKDGKYAPRGDVFDVGITTVSALRRIASGMAAVVAGGEDANSNGNGSLMRILPVAIRFANANTSTLLANCHVASQITHGHDLSKMACGFYALMVRELLNGKDADLAWRDASESFEKEYQSAGKLLEHFDRLNHPTFPFLDSTDIRSSGYVMDTLEAAVWCLLNTESYADCVLLAVNLGADTDTTACVAGGLAGLLYGFGDIPGDWVSALPPGDPPIDGIFKNFTAILTAPSDPPSEPPHVVGATRVARGNARHETLLHHPRDGSMTSEELASYAKEILEHGPTRVVVDAKGYAVGPWRAEKVFKVKPDVVFVRNDRWSLGATREHELLAYNRWKNDWVGFMNLDEVDKEIRPMSEWEDQWP